MKKIAIFSYWKNRWVYYLQDYLGARGYEVKYSPTVDIQLLQWADVAWIAWANEMAVQISNLPIKYCKNIVYVRGYEVFGNYFKQINWNMIDEVIFTNDGYIEISKKQGLQMPPERIHSVTNAINTTVWKYQEHKKGTKLAFVSNVNHKKGFPLLLQIFAELPDQYELHFIGMVQELRFWVYFCHLANEMGLGKRINYGGGNLTAANQIQDWLKDKDYILSCSPTEGNPNCLLEAMSCGLKPIIHNWIGAKKQFPPQLVFNKVSEAVKLITEDAYDSKSYRQFIEDNYDFLKVYQKLEVILNE